MSWQNLQLQNTRLSPGLVLAGEEETLGSRKRSSQSSFFWGWGLFVLIQEKEKVWRKKQKKLTDL